MKPYINNRKCYVDPNLCTAIKSCTQNAISYFEDEDAPLGGRIEFDYDQCKECGTCAKECCGNAIDMK
ncbi:MAG: hypothetical protein N2484_10320 [Clostridia bacterium]|nr:hypothetical protein [Clostridia bacterium]